MRTILLLTTALVCFGWIATQIDLSPSSRLPYGGIHRKWRRTAEGWQRAESWSVAPSARSRELLPHPLVLALGELLSALFVLTAFAPRRPTALIARGGSRAGLLQDEGNIPWRGIPQEGALATSPWD